MNHTSGINVLNSVPMKQYQAIHEKSAGCLSNQANADCARHNWDTQATRAIAQIEQHKHIAQIEK